MDAFEYGEHRRRFHELRDELLRIEADGGCFEGKLDEIHAVYDTAKTHKDGYALVREIIEWEDSFLKGNKIYDPSIYITRQELERTIHRDQYFTNNTKIFSQFHDEGVLPTINTPERLVDTWFMNGLPSIAGCPWSRPPVYDYAHEEDCKKNPDNSRCFEVHRLRKFLLEKDIPLPSAIFPEDQTNTSNELRVLARLNQTLLNIRNNNKPSLCANQQPPSKNNIHFETATESNELCAEFEEAWNDGMTIDKIKKDIAELEAVNPISTDDFREKKALLQEMKLEIARLLAGEPQSTPLEVTQPATADSVNPRRGRRACLTDTKCLTIYRKHYAEGLSIARLSNDYDWKNSPFADNPTAETAKSRIKSAINRGRNLTPLRDRPETDTKRAATGRK